MSEESEDDVKAISTLISVLKPLDEATRVHVLEFVLKRLGISLTVGSGAPIQMSDSQNLSPVHPVPPAPAVSRVVDIRSFAAEKNPKTVNERVAVIGYYLANLAALPDRRDCLVADDIKTYFIQAGFPLPTSTANVTLTNAKNAGYLIALDRGQYRLNPVGHNLVAHKLPNEGTGETKRAVTKKLVGNKVRLKAKK
jgi:hypothetical protein